MFKILASIGAAIVVGISSFFGIHKPPAKVQVAVTPTKPVERSATSEAKPMSFKDLLTTKGAQKCTFTSSTTSGNTVGVIYSTGGRVKGDITTSVNGKTTVSHIVMEGNEMRMWEDGQSQGVMTTFDAKAVATQVNSTNSQLNVDQKYNYDCKPATVNDSTFQVPATLKFLDVSKMIPSIPKISITIPAIDAGKVKSMQCSACNALTGEAKTQCLSTLQCN